MKFEKRYLEGRTSEYGKPEMLIKDVERRIMNEGRFSLVGFEITNMKFIKRSLNCKYDRDNSLYFSGMFEEYFIGCETYMVAEDEIIVVMEDADPDEVYKRSMKFMEMFSEPVLLNGIHINIKLACGIVEYQQGSGTAEKLYGKLGKAILASYELKERICSYSEEVNGALRKKLYDRMQIYNAIVMNRLKLEYQPKFSLETNMIKGAEALLRWDESGMDAAEIVKTAEEVDMMTQLTKWVARETIEQLGRWKSKGIDTAISINVTKADLLDDSLLEFMVSCLEDSQVDADCIELEIKDSCIEENGKDIMKVVKRFKEHGFGIAADNFNGNRGSSDRIDDLPFYKVKIEKSMIKDIENEVRLSKVENIIKRAKESRIDVVAEGIETETQYMILQYLGCDMMQGFYISKPLSPDKYAETLKENYTLFPHLSQDYSDYVV